MLDNASMKLAEVQSQHFKARDIQDWQSLLDITDNLVEELRIKTLSKRGRLAYCMILVGSYQLDLFIDVFDCLQ